MLENSLGGWILWEDTYLYPIAYFQWAFSAFTFTGSNPKHMKSAHLHLVLLQKQQVGITLGSVEEQHCPLQLASSWSSWWMMSLRSYYVTPSGPLLSGDLTVLKKKKKTRTPKVEGILVKKTIGSLKVNVILVNHQMSWPSCKTILILELFKRKYRSVAWQLVTLGWG